MRLTSHFGVMISVISIVMQLTAMRSGQTMDSSSAGGEGVWPGVELTHAFASFGNIVVLPLGVEEIEGAGFGMNFYVGWGGAAPPKYNQVSEMVGRFRGQLKWSIKPDFNNRGAFISALPLAQARRYFGGQQVEFVSLANLNAEVKEFCNFVSESLQETVPTSGNNPEVKADAEPFEDSAYSVLLVAEPETFSGNPTSSSDRMLHIGITEGEWIALSHEAEANLGSVSYHQASFLLGLKQRYETVRLSPIEVVSLSNELAKSESDATTEGLQQAIRKVRRILLEAADDRLGVVFEPND
jgi:hypothetical protein